MWLGATDLQQEVQSHHNVLHILNDSFCLKNILRKSICSIERVSGEIQRQDKCLTLIGFGWLARLVVLAFSSFNEKVS